jgi:polyisoprenyl-phosphate glycosyltransferase
MCCRFDDISYNSPSIPPFNFKVLFLIKFKSFHMAQFSLVIPVFNEELIIDQLYSRCTEALAKITDEWEIICVDDGSTDRTLELLTSYHQKDKRFKLVSLSRNFGHQAAILAGMSFAKGEYIGIIDGDLQDPPEVLQQFYDKAKEGFDVVYAVRKKRKEGIIKKSVYWLYYRILGKVSNTPIPLDSGDFSVIRRCVVDYILSMREQSLYIRGIRSWIGFRQVGLEYEREKRFAGEPKYNFRKLFKLAWNGIFSFSDFPIKMVSRIGFLVSAFSFGYICVTLFKKFVYGNVPQGFTTIIIFLTLFSGVQLLALGLIGEYVIRIYDETRKRPLFIVRDKFIED